MAAPQVDVPGPRGAFGRPQPHWGGREGGEFDFAGLEETNPYYRSERRDLRRRQRLLKARRERVAADSLLEDCVEKGLHRGIHDFDDHMSDISKDWLNATLLG